MPPVSGNQNKEIGITGESRHIRFFVARIGGRGSLLSAVAGLALADRSCFPCMPGALNTRVADRRRKARGQNQFYQLSNVKCLPKAMEVSLPFSGLMVKE
ncbi:hypothetical protein [Azospirillum sp. B510]|uniref:hypothetical protein n=1 Tax=Azospirillum sp. (strain B510) TaxID=137722 RepID=UPI0011D16F47|nr:hypothetical protein [Azospirillum sp. B510]